MSCQLISLPFPTRHPLFGWSLPKSRHPHRAPIDAEVMDLTAALSPLAGSIGIFDIALLSFIFAAHRTCSAWVGVPVAVALEQELYMLGNVGVFGDALLGVSRGVVILGVDIGELAASVVLM